MPQNQISCSGCLSQIPQGVERCPYCGQVFNATNPAGTLPVNTLLEERYTIGKCLSLDGEGVLYAAVDGVHSRRVVIKEYVPVTICMARAASGAVIPRNDRAVLFKTTRMDFIDLYRSLVAIGAQAGMVQVFDLFEANNTAYAVREPDSGVSLTQYLQKRGAPLSQDDAIAMLRPIVYAVDTMHRKGLLHRGISTDTIYINAGGVAKLSGFATCGLRTADSELKSHLFEGYAAPEQYFSAEFDGNYTDVYALGALFYRVLTGKLPQPARARRQTDLLQAPQSVNSAIAPFVSTAIMRAMRIVSAERMQSASDLMAALVSPQQDAHSFHFTARQKRYLLIGLIGLLIAATVSIWAIIAWKPSGQTVPSESVSSDTSDSTSIEDVVETIVLPNFLGEQYADVQQDATYHNMLLFKQEDEQYSSDYAKGEIINQLPAPNTEVEVGSVVKLIVSLGPRTAPMPAVTGLTAQEATSALRLLEIQYTLLYLENDGRYESGTVVKTDTPMGTEVDINKTNVVLYIAKDAPEPEPEPEEETPSEPTPEDPTSTPEPAPDGTVPPEV